MKENWKTKPLIEFCNEVTDGSHFSPKTSVDLQYAYITVRDIVKDEIIFEGCKRLEKNDYLDLVKNGCKPEFGDLLFSKDGTVGKVALVKTKEDFVVLSSLALIRPNREIITPEFLKYVLLNPAFIKEAVGKKTGVAIRRIILRNLKQINIHVPDSLEEQKQIVAILDKAFAAIDQAKTNIEKNIENAKELFDSKREDYFNQLSVNNDLLPINEVCEKIFAGGDKPKENFSKTPTEDLNIPIIANAVKDNGLYGYTNKAKVTKPSITIAARGSGTGHTEYRDYPFVPIVRLIVLTPNTDKIEVEFLMYSIKNLTISRSGSAIPQLTVPMIKSYSIPVPLKEKQKEIVDSLNQLEIQLEEYKVALAKKLVELEDLKKSILQKAFAGELTQEATRSKIAQVQ